MEYSKVCSAQRQDPNLKAASMSSYLTRTIEQKNAPPRTSACMAATPPLPLPPPEGGFESLPPKAVKKLKRSANGDPSR